MIRTMGLTDDDELIFDFTLGEIAGPFIGVVLGGF